VDNLTKQKRRLVAKKRLAAGLERGGLGISHPNEIIRGFQKNLVEKNTNMDPLSPQLTFPPYFWDYWKGQTELL
jgi:hypothetical protein